MALSDFPKDMPVSTNYSEFLFTANRPEHSAAVAARLAHFPDRHRYSSQNSRRHRLASVPRSAPGSDRLLQHFPGLPGPAVTEKAKLLSAAFIVGSKEMLEFLQEIR